MILNRERAKYSENTFFPCQFIHHNFHVGSNHYFHDEMPATNLLIHGMARSFNALRTGDADLRF